jgi:tetratricopeptide (TPR) repeat protein
MVLRFNDLILSFKKLRGKARNKPNEEASAGEAKATAPRDARSFSAPKTMTAGNAAAVESARGARGSRSESAGEIVSAEGRRRSDRRRRAAEDPTDLRSAEARAVHALGKAGEAGTDEMAALDAAVVDCRAALAQLTRERAPLKWATAQAELASALQTLGERKGGVTELEEAIAAYEEALKECIRARAPLQWATIKTSLGDSLWLAGERGHNYNMMAQAVAAYSEALLEHSRERAPLQFAALQHNIGNILSTLGQKDATTETLERAIEAFDEALTERTSARARFLWALSLGNQGVTRLLLAAKTSQTDSAAQALEQIAMAAEALRSTNFKRQAAFYDGWRDAWQRGRMASINTIGAG